MSIAVDSHAEQELIELDGRFHQWRQSRTTPRERIPRRLWDQAASLSTVLPISRVAKTLRLSPGELKKHRVARPGTVPEGPAQAPPGFVEVAETSPPCDRTVGAEVQLQRPDGTRMCIQYADSQAPLAALVRVFLEKP